MFLEISTLEGEALHFPKRQDYVIQWRRVVSQNNGTLSYTSVTTSEHSNYYLVFDVHESVHRDAVMKVTNKMQLYRLIYYS
jgi:hypothetical protein